MNLSKCFSSTSRSNMTPPRGKALALRSAGWSRTKPTSPPPQWIEPSCPTLHHSAVQCHTKRMLRDALKVVGGKCLICSVEAMPKSHATASELRRHDDWLTKDDRGRHATVSNIAIPNKSMIGMVSSGPMIDVAISSLDLRVRLHAQQLLKRL